MHRIMVGTTEITDYIVDGTYEMDAEDTYESWKDGNARQHRVIITSKVSGSFDVACANETISLADFNNIFSNAATSGHVIMNVYVTNQGTTKAITAYYHLKNKDHILRADGTYIDVVTVEVEEQ